MLYSVGTGNGRLHRMPAFLIKKLENYMEMIYDCNGETSLLYPLRRVCSRPSTRQPHFYRSFLFVLRSYIAINPCFRCPFSPSARFFSSILVPSLQPHQRIPFNLTRPGTVETLYAHVVNRRCCYVLFTVPAELRPSSLCTKRRNALRSRFAT